MPSTITPHAHAYHITCEACPDFQVVRRSPAGAERIAVRHNRTHTPTPPPSVPTPTTTITPDAAEGGIPCYVVRCSHCQAFARFAFHKPNAEGISARHLAAHAAESNPN